MPQDKPHANAQDKRQLILTAAADVFAANGFHQATIDQIAEAAGVGKGTVYLYFKSKQGLFHALLLDSIQQWLQQVEEVVQQSTAPLERIRKLIGLHLKILQDGHPLMQIVMRELNQGNMDNLRSELLQQVKRLLQFYVVVLEEGIATGCLKRHNTQLAAIACLGAVNQVGVSLMHGNVDASLVESEETIYQIFIGGLHSGIR